MKSLYGLEQNNQRIAKNTFFLTIRMIIVLAVGLYSSRVLLKVLGIEDFGIYNVVGGFVLMFSFLNTSMSNAIQRFYNYELGRNGAEGVRRVYNCSLVTQLLIAIIVIVLTETFGLWYIKTKLIIPPNRFASALWIFHLSVLSLLFLIVQIPYSAAIMAYERMNYYALVSIFDAILKFLIVLALPFIPFDHLVVYGVLMVLISLSDFLLYFIYANRRFSEIRIEKKLRKGYLRKYCLFPDGI